MLAFQSRLNEDKVSFKKSAKKGDCDSNSKETLLENLIQFLHLLQISFPLSFSNPTITKYIIALTHGGLGSKSPSILQFTVYQPHKYHFFSVYLCHNHRVTIAIIILFQLGELYYYCTDYMKKTRIIQLIKIQLVKLYKLKYILYLSKVLFCI